MTTAPLAYVVLRPSTFVHLNEEPMSTEKNFEDLYRELDETVR